jgi:thioredoxin 2
MKLTCLACGQVNRVPEARLAAGPKCGTCGEKLIGGRVPEIDAATLDKAVRNNELPLVVDFSAAWCGPCRMMTPEFAKAATALAPGVRLAKIDTEAHSDVSARFGNPRHPASDHLPRRPGGGTAGRGAAGGRDRAVGAERGGGAGLTRMQTTIFGTGGDAP